MVTNGGIVLIKPGKVLAGCEIVGKGKGALAGEPGVVAEELVREPSAPCPALWTGALGFLFFV